MIIDDRAVIAKLNKAVRPEVEYYVVEDNYKHTLETEMAQSIVLYSDCGSQYTVKFTPAQTSTDTIPIGTITTYTVSKSRMKVTSVLEQ